jgi:type IV pilus assembly protein PilB
MDETTNPVETGPQKYTDAGLKKAYELFVEKLDHDFLQFELEDKKSFDAIWDGATHGTLMTHLTASRGIEFDLIAQVSANEYKCAYLPNPAGLRTETLELYSKLIETHDMNGWVPLQLMGPGLILGHFIPTYPKPPIAGYIASYALISEKAYWDYQMQVQNMDIRDVRTQNNYKVITPAMLPTLHKEEPTYGEYLEYLQLALHESSHELQQVKNLIAHLKGDKSAVAEPEKNGVENKFLDEEVTDGVIGLKGKINTSYDTWIAYLDTLRKDDVRELLNVGDEFLPVLNLEEILLGDDCKEYLQKYRLDLGKLLSIPVYLTADTVGIASARADDPDVRAYLNELVVPRKLQVYLTSERSYNNTEGNLRQNIESAAAVELFTQGMDIETTEEQIEDLDAGQYTENDDRVINFVNKVLKTAIELKASDIHMEVTGGRFRIRYRIDGRMQAMFKPFPAELAPFAIRRIKILCKMNTSMNRIPLDGGMKIRMGKTKRTIDLRVATCPVVSSGSDGSFEKCTIRILDDESGPSRLDEILWIAKQRETLKRVMLNPYGIIIVTGPTGSGKSTTLYSVLNELNNGDINIVTAEDPVERKIAGVNQTPVMAPNTFAKTLRSFLRMDPDVILVGEVRDAETADLAIKASQTGHLVLTTLHANTALGAIGRLEGLGVKREDIAGALLMASAQRLGRKLCKSCRRKRPATKAELSTFHAKKISSELISSGYLYEGRGCPMCGFRGYKGRVAIMEMLEVTNSVKDQIENAKLSINDLKRYVMEKEGFTNMYTNGLHAVARGEMDFKELVEEVPDDSEGLIINIEDEEITDSDKNR